LVAIFAVVAVYFSGWSLEATVKNAMGGASAGVDPLQSIVDCALRALHGSLSPLEDICMPPRGTKEGAGHLIDALEAMQGRDGVPVNICPILLETLKTAQRHAKREGEPFWPVTSVLDTQSNGSYSAWLYQEKEKEWIHVTRRPCRPKIHEPSWTGRPAAMSRSLSFTEMRWSMNEGTAEDTDDAIKVN
jgi:hypothetical protein